MNDQSERERKKKNYLKQNGMNVGHGQNQTKKKKDIKTRRQNQMKEIKKFKNKAPKQNYITIESHV